MVSRVLPSACGPSPYPSSSDKDSLCRRQDVLFDFNRNLPDCKLLQDHHGNLVRQCLNESSWAPAGQFPNAVGDLIIVNGAFQAVLKTSELLLRSHLDGKVKSLPLRPLFLRHPDETTHCQTPNDDPLSEG